MSRRVGWIVVTLCLLYPTCRSHSAQAQIEFLEDLPPGFEIFLKGKSPPQPAQAGQSGAKASAGSDRQKKLQALEFDRRPSAILKAWSTPPKPPEDETAKTSDSAGPMSPGEEDGANAEEAKTEDENTKADDEANEAEKKAADKKAAEKKAAEKKAADKKALEAELALFQRNVTRGKWEAVKSYLGGLEEAEAKAGYEQMIRSLQRGPKDRPKNQQQAKYAEKNFFSPEDIIAIADVAPVEIDKKNLSLLGSILRECLANGNVVEHVLNLLKTGLQGEDYALTRREAARLMMAAGEAVAAGDFLPSLEEVQKADDREGFNLLSRHYLALYDEEKKTEFLEQAWRVTQAVLAAGEVSKEDKEEGLKRAIDLAPKLRKELGQAWLDESFTERPDRGMEIIAGIGSAASRGMQLQSRNSKVRLKGLQLQATAVEALIDAAPERAEEWSESLTLLASNWLYEAVFSYQYDQSTSRGPSLNRDVFGNYFYFNRNPTKMRGNVPQAIATGELLEIRPSERWLALTGVGLQPKFLMIYAQLFLKVGEESEAFPFIEQVAGTYPDNAMDLVDEFLRVWTRNHNPNQNQERTNPYIYVYGFESRANSIPLTRSKQERNLQDLSEWVARLRKLPIDHVDEELLAQAFTAAHSTAEVYRLETIERVFGTLKDLDPETLATLIQTMRSNLVGVWRQPSIQKDKKTNRRQKDIESEVLRGYSVATAVIDEGLAKHPEEWNLLVARAALRHDQNNYQQEIEKTPEFTSRRNESFEVFKTAAERYALVVGEISEDDESTNAYDTWFYAALGSCDLGAVDENNQPANHQMGLLRNAIESLPGEAADRHIAMFANNLFVRMGTVNPAVKYRYLRAGLEIVGDHEMAREASQVFDYYKDLITEIELETRVDGSDVVGHDEPFGLWVNLRHTREIEREAGGFSKYLTNQNNQYFSWNYGRPTEDYRDKFDEAAREALEERFEVLSITFNHPSTNSRATEEYGWRVTPYAYILLKPRGPEVDRIPQLRIDMDFLDTSGYAIIPIESSPLPIDAKAVNGDDRPFDKLRITQILDERQAEKGRLLLEVKATAHGLVPELDAIVGFEPSEFEIVATEDQGVSLSEFDEDAEEATVVSERTWMITMAGRDDLEQLPETFTFAQPVSMETEVEYQRFIDADLESVEATISLEANYGETSGSWIWLFPVVGVVLLVGAIVGLRLRKKPELGPQARYTIPVEVTPFTAIGLLRDLERNNGFDSNQRQMLNGHIDHIERYFFVDDSGEEPDLKQIVSTWVGEAR